MNNRLILENQELIECFKTLFDNDLVEGKNSFIPSEDDLQKIFRVLNELVFDNRLSDISLFSLDVNEFMNLLSTNYEVNSETLEFAKTAIAVYACKRDVVNDKLVVYNECIMYNTSIGKCSFGFVVGCVCHEMIHYYDAHFGNLSEKTIEHGNYNSHYTSTFLRYMKKAKERFDIPIIIDGNNVPTQKLSRSAQEFFTREKLLENELNSDQLIERVVNNTIVKQISKTRYLILEIN